jgi:Dockerin type I domain
MSHNGRPRAGLSRVVSLRTAVPPCNSVNTLQAEKTEIRHRGIYLQCTIAVLILIGPLSVTARASCNFVPFVTTQSWSGTITIVGTGQGTITSNGITDSYTIQQTIVASPNLNLPGPLVYEGNTNARIHIFEQDVETIPNQPPITTTFTVDAFLPLGTISPGGGTQLFFNIDACTYEIDSDWTIPGNLCIDNGVPGGALGTCIAGPAAQLPGCNAILGGAPCGPLPMTGTTISGSVTFQADPALPIVSCLATTCTNTTWTVSWNFLPSDCGPIPINPLNQGSQPWGPQFYDSESKQPPTIGRWGCAMTSMTMGMTAAGFRGNSFVNPDPGSVNSFMQQKAGDFIGDKVNWDPAVRDLSQGTLKFKSLPNLDSAQDPISAPIIVNQQLCAQPPRPVIVGVKSCADGNGNRKFPCHFVLINGIQNGKYTIVDPATGSQRDLASAYGNRFTIRGSVIDPPGDISALDLAIDHNASMMMTAPDGTQTGLTPGAGTILQNIAQSAYYIDQFEDAEMLGLTGPAAVTDSAHILNIFQPSPGTFRVVVSGTSAGPYHLSVRPFAQDGSAQAPINLSGSAEPGSLSTYVISYSSAPGSSSTITRMAGDRNGDGMVNCTDLDIVKASFGKSIGQAGFDPRADVNADGVVNIVDLATVAKALPAGTTCP